MGKSVIIFQLDDELKRRVIDASRARNPATGHSNISEYVRESLRLMLAIDNDGWDVAREDFDHEAEDKNES